MKKIMRCEYKECVQKEFHCDFFVGSSAGTTGVVYWGKIEMDKTHYAEPGTWINNFIGLRIVNTVERVISILYEDVGDSSGLDHNLE